MSYIEYVLHLGDFYSTSWRCFVNSWQFICSKDIALKSILIISQFFPNSFLKFWYCLSCLCTISFILNTNYHMESWNKISITPLQAHIWSLVSRENIFKSNFKLRLFFSFFLFYHGWLPSENFSIPCLLLNPV